MLTFAQGRSQGGCPRCPGTPLGQKISEVGTELKNHSQELKFFSLAGTPLSIFLATPLNGP